MEKSRRKREAFLRLATKRTNAVLDRLRVLGHCANRHQYEYTDDDVKKIIRAIEAELRVVKTKFQDEQQAKFTLNSR